MLERDRTLPCFFPFTVSGTCFIVVSKFVSQLLAVLLPLIPRLTLSRLDGRPEFVKLGKEPRMGAQPQNSGCCRHAAGPLYSGFSVVMAKLRLHAVFCRGT